MLSEDSVWCCIFSSYCKQPRHFWLQNILNVSESNIVPLIVSFVTVVTFTLIYFFNQYFRNQSKEIILKKNLKVNQKTDLLLKPNVNQMKKSKIKASRIKAPANTINVHSDSLKGVDFAVQDFIQTIDRTQLQAGEPITTDATRISIQDKSSSPLPHSVAQLTI